MKYKNELKLKRGAGMEGENVFGRYRIGPGHNVITLKLVVGGHWTVNQIKDGNSNLVYYGLQSIVEIVQKHHINIQNVPDNYTMVG